MSRRHGRPMGGYTFRIISQSLEAFSRSSIFCSLRTINAARSAALPPLAWPWALICSVIASPDPYAAVPEFCHRLAVFLAFATAVTTVIPYRA